jgi:hypothetical protein
VFLFVKPKPNVKRLKAFRPLLPLGLNIVFPWYIDTALMTLVIKSSTKSGRPATNAGRPDQTQIEARASLEQLAPLI